MEKRYIILKVNSFYAESPEEAQEYLKEDEGKGEVVIKGILDNPTDAWKNLGEYLQGNPEEAINPER